MSGQGTVLVAEGASTVAVLGGLTALARLLWRVSAQWTSAALRIQQLTDDLSELTRQKESDHARIAGRVDRVDAAVHRHLAWHAHRASDGG
jgi:hypothetical protein